MKTEFNYHANEVAGPCPVKVLGRNGTWDYFLNPVGVPVALSNALDASAEELRGLFLDGGVWIEAAFDGEEGWHGNDCYTHAHLFLLERSGVLPAYTPDQYPICLSQFRALSVYAKAECPIKCVGIKNGMFVFRRRHGDVIKIPSDLIRDYSTLVTLFDSDMSWPAKWFFSSDIPVNVNLDALAIQLIAECYTVASKRSK
ncbi:MAG: hypothetical protein VX620_15425 [Pseudomonadota bacterium]|nr:hypothetical protein [Pseudomonadota bacterium]